MSFLEFFYQSLQQSHSLSGENILIKSNFFKKPYWPEMKVLQEKIGYYFRILY